MPIALFQQIVNQCYPRIKHPAGDRHSFVTDHYIVPARELTANGLAFNDGIPTLAIFNDERGEVTVSQHGQTYRVRLAWLSGPYLENVHFQAWSNQSDLLILRFNPVLFYQRLKINPASLRKKPVWSLPEALGMRGRLLLATIAAKHLVSEKVNAVELFMQACGPVTANELVVEACALINQCKGQTSVARVVNKLKLNYKWLERNFNQYLGVSPKEYILLQRFKHAYVDLTGGRRYFNLLEIALTNGYYDAAHLSKDLLRFTGTAGTRPEPRGIGV